MAKKKREGKPPVKRGRSGPKDSKSKAKPAPADAEASKVKRATSKSKPKPATTGAEAPKVKKAAEQPKSSKVKPKSEVMATKAEAEAPKKKKETVPKMPQFPVRGKTKWADQDATGDAVIKFTKEWTTAAESNLQTKAKLKSSSVAPPKEGPDRARKYKSTGGKQPRKQLAVMMTRKQLDDRRWEEQNGVTAEEKARVGRCPVCGTWIKSLKPSPNSVCMDFGDCVCGKAKGCSISKPTWEMNFDGCGYYTADDGNGEMEYGRKFDDGEIYGVESMVNEAVEEWFGDKGSEMRPWNQYGNLLSNCDAEHLLDSAVDMQDERVAGLRIKAFAYLIQRNEDYVRKGPVGPDQLCSCMPFSFVPILVDARDRTDAWVWCIKDESAMNEVLKANGHRDVAAV
jgi:hypothetical protein